MNETKPLDVVLTFFMHVLATLGSVALAHHFVPGSVVWMFVAILFGCLLVNWHKNPNPQSSVIGLVTLGLKRGKQVVDNRAKRPKLIDTLPPEEPKKA